MFLLDGLINIVAAVFVMYAQSPFYEITLIAIAITVFLLIKKLIRVFKE